MHPELPIECNVCGSGVLNPTKHRAWHAEQRPDDPDPADHELTYADVITRWLDELDPSAVEQLVLHEAPSMNDSAVVGTIAVLRKVAKGEA